LGYFLEPQGCTEANAMNDNADPWECYSSGTSGVTVYREQGVFLSAWFE
jgi:hypothetical protein